MKIVSWNINGIRAAMNKGLKRFIDEQKPDILCLQEIKISNEARAKIEFDFSGYEEYWHSAMRPGYSGTSILIKSEKLRVKSYFFGFPDKNIDNEGRVQTLEFYKFYLMNVYFPNANHELTRLEFKLEFNDKILKYAKSLEKRKPVLICGDYNVAHEEIDLARPKNNKKNAGFTPEERASMDKFINAGFVDTFRHFNKNKVQYSWWGYRFNSRARNIGWRVDYFCASKKMMKYIKDAFILDHVTGSDHAPVGVEIKL